MRYRWPHEMMRTLDDHCVCMDVSHPHDHTNVFQSSFQMFCLCHLFESHNSLSYANEFIEILCQDRIFLYNTVEEGLNT